MAPRQQLRDDSRRSVRREILRFAIPGVIGIVLLALASLLVSAAVAREQSLREAETTAQWLARTVVAPLLDADLSSGKARPIAELDAAFATSVRGSDVVAVRLWNSDGVIIYSDDPRLMGEDLPPPVGSDRGIISGGTDPGRPENRYLDPDQEIVQVSLPVDGTDGARYLFQINQLQDTIQQDTRSIWVAFAPVLVGSLALLGLLLVLWGVVMARRIGSDLRTRQELLAHAIDASDVERRRIAADLHDGTVQDLAGLSFTLAGLATKAQSAGDSENAALLSEAALRSRNSVRELRTLLVDIYPPNLEMAGLAAALADQIAPLEAQMSVTTQIADLPALDETTRAGVYRIAREALTNVQKHSRADRVLVALGEHDGEVVLRVEDDGRGFDTARVEDGHMGLRVIGDLAASLGGRLSVSSRPGQGTAVEFRVRQP